MKSEEEGVERFVVGGFKDGSIISEYYVGRNDGSFEKVNEYFEVELIKGKNMISISCDGIKIIDYERLDLSQFTWNEF